MTAVPVTDDDSCGEYRTARRRRRAPRSVEPDGVAEEVDLEGAHRFVWRRGAIVTAEEALEADEDITITVPDGRRIGATLAGRDPTTDVAVLRVTDNEISPHS